jgi:hypothetical protein
MHLMLGAVIILLSFQDMQYSQGSVVCRAVHPVHGWSRSRSLWFILREESFLVHCWFPVEDQDCWFPVEDQDCWFPVEDQVGWIFFSTCILQVEVIRWLKWIKEVGTKVSFSISSVRSRSQVEIYN